VLLRFWN